MSTTRTAPKRYVNVIARFPSLTEAQALEVVELLRNIQRRGYPMSATRGDYEDYGSYGLRVGIRKAIL